MNCDGSYMYCMHACMHAISKCMDIVVVPGPGFDSISPDLISFDVITAAAISALSVPFIASVMEILSLDAKPFMIVNTLFSS